VTYTIYALVDPRDGATRYVGCTKQPLDRRLAQHMLAPMRGNEHKWRWVQELQQAGLRPEITPLEEPTELPDKVEQRWIAARRAEGCELLNTTRRLPYRARRPRPSVQLIHERWFTPKEIADRL
jgi:hypothetical protein